MPNDNNCSIMLCGEGKLSIKCFLGTAALVFTLTTSQNVLGFTPNHIWGASLWGPVFYFVIICISLRLFLNDEKYQVSKSIRRNIQNTFTKLEVFLVSVCHTIDILRIYVRLQHITGCSVTVKMEGIRCVRHSNVNISLFRIFGYRLVQSELVVHQFVHFKPFTALCLSCDFQLDWISCRSQSVARNKGVLAGHDYRCCTVSGRWIVTEIGNYNSKHQFQSYRKLRVLFVLFLWYEKRRNSIGDLLLLPGKLTRLNRQFGSSFNFNIFGENIIRSLDAIFRFNLKKATIINLLRMVSTLWFVTHRMSVGFGGQSERR